MGSLGYDIGIAQILDKSYRRLMYYRVLAVITINTKKTALVRPTRNGTPNAESDQKYATRGKRGGGKGEKLFFGKVRFGQENRGVFPGRCREMSSCQKSPDSRSGKSGKKREDLTSPDTSPEHISGFQNMLRLLTQVFFYQRLKKYTPLDSNQ